MNKDETEKNIDNFKSLSSFLFFLTSQKNDQPRTSRKTRTY